MIGVLRWMSRPLFSYHASKWNVGIRTPRQRSSSSSHSLRYLFTGVSEPGQGLPQFIALGYVDGQLFVQYDSNTRRTKSRAPWMEKVAEEDPQYWDTQTQLARGIEEIFRVNLETARNYYNLSKVSFPAFWGGWDPGHPSQDRQESPA
ncbi:hypothetical protein JRQ81_012240 [Phrynocephalus forsythii]|uniref:MHC class I-like antigen recognition-like domain-containing protein n=1 Tax=Phrynocephalus forsythii TaxID=171643 RepID=A0A9Q1AQ07_9SAUR|nr:hypothetical protein JRQ81_012240 [Phrynocephalus forsythii]